MMEIWGTDTFLKFEKRHCSFEVKGGCLTVKMLYWEGDGEGGETEGEAEATLDAEETEAVRNMLVSDAIRSYGRAIKSVYEPQPSLQVMLKKG